MLMIFTHPNLKLHDVFVSRGYLFLWLVPAFVSFFDMSLVAEELPQAFISTASQNTADDKAKEGKETVSSPAQLEELKKALTTRDTNQDGSLTEEEYLSTVPKDAQPKSQRDFRMFDRDDDKSLTVLEFGMIPGAVPKALQVPLPHPLTPLIEKHFAVIEAGWNAWDLNNDATLSRREFKAAGLTDKIPGLETSTWNDWDRDGNKELSREDCRWLIEAGYGLRRLDGQKIYLPTGQVAYWWHFKELDRDKNDSLSPEEFLNYYKRFGEEDAKKRFQNADADKNNRLTLQEWLNVSSGNLINPIADFQRMDVSLDGQIDRTEFLDGVMPFLRPLARYMLPGFDLNQDGLLSLDEFRLTMPINRIENWDLNSKDADHDGRLSLKELAWTPGVELSLLRHEYFNRLDLNKNGFLDFDEFKFTVDVKRAPAKVRLQVSLASRDTDKDGRVTEQEFVNSASKNAQPAAKRDFQLFDVNADKILSLQEFSTIPGLIPTAQRGALPHPLTPLIEKLMAVLTKEWKQWDTDNNGNLSKKEFDAAKLVDRIPGLTPSTWKDWDRDADGEVSLEDCRWLIEAGYGLRRLDGQQIQLPSGLVVYWWHFKNLDRDKDDGLTQAEFLAYYKRLGEKEANRRFKNADRDKDSRITLREWAKMSGHLLDPIAEFQMMDLNFNARLEKEELQQKTAKWLQPLSKFNFPGFDLNQDGSLSLDEYRMTLAANRLENWDVTSRDADNDGRLSLSELAWTPGLELSLLRKEYFNRLDINDNGFIDLNEFKFTTDTKQAPPKVVLEVALASRDANEDGRLTEAEYVAGVAEKAQPAAKRDFRLFDRDADKTLSLQEFSTIPGVIPTALRGEMPHPLTPLVDQEMAALEENWKQWDTDSNKTLSHAEFQAAQLAKRISGLERSNWDHWDRDSSGEVSLEDCRWLIEAGYGLRRLDGQQVHLPSGHIIYWWYYRQLDRNGDEGISLKEFLPYFKKQGVDVATQRFQRTDTDKDGRITLREWPNLSGNLIDPMADFQKMDVDLDGGVNHEELMQGVMPFLQPLAQYMLPGFDLDKDGKLSLDEYRMTLPVNRIENWLRRLSDRNYDGRLSLPEFVWTHGLELSLLRKEYFNRLDIDKSGFLELDEFEFTINMQRIAPRYQFGLRDKDKDGQLALAEVLAAEKMMGKVKLDGTEEPRVKLIKAAYKKADVDGDSLISAAEFNTPNGMQIIYPPEPRIIINPSGVAVAELPQQEGESERKMTIVLVVNGILVLALIAFCLRFLLKKARK